MQIAGSRVSFSDETIRVGVWTCGEHPRTPLPHPPTLRLAWSSRIMSHLEGNPSAVSSRIVLWLALLLIVVV